MREHILLPTDFSDNAWIAALYAFKLYEAVPCTFYFLHSSIIKGSTRSSMSSKLTRVVTENAKNGLAQVKQKAEQHYANANHQFETILSSYDLRDSLESIIKKQKIDLVIMGTKGATKAEEIVFGSNTVHIIQSVKQCPVLAIPDEYEFKQPEKIAFPTDFSRSYGDELQPLKDMAALYNSKIEIVHINKAHDISEAQDYNLDQLKVALKDYSPNFHSMPSEGSKERGITHFIEKFDINMLVMINYPHSFIDSFMKEPIIKKIGFKSSIPFLVIPG